MSQLFEDNEWSRDPEGRSFDIVHEQAAFLLEVAILISSLPGVRQPSSEQHTYGFTFLPFSTPYELPGVLKSEAQRIDDLFIYIGDAHKAETPKETDIPAYLSLEFNAGTDTYLLSSAGFNDSDEFTLSKFDAKDYRHSEPNATFEARLKDVGTVTKAELNSLIMSIVMPNEMGDYEAYADKDLQSSQAFESLCELLSQKALTQTEAFYFVFGDEETEFHFTKENGQTTSFTISYYDPRRNLPISVEYDISVDFTLRFFSHEESEKHPFIPTGEEINFARSILKAELSSFEPQLFKVDEEGVVIEPESKPTDYEHRLSNELSGLVDAVLNKLGLNPPNPGT